MAKNNSIVASKDTQAFSASLQVYRNRIDSALTEYVQELESHTSEQFGGYPLETVKAFTDVLSRGGKRIRGSLAIAAYEMFGGTDEHMITAAASALEILNTYILIADDIQDRSHTRRGGKTAHIILKEYHEQNYLYGDSQHFGESIAINAFLIAQHYAMNILANLNAPAERKIKAIDNVNRCFIATAHGQTLDIFNEVVACVGQEDVDNVLEWKTAYYTFINPLQLGAILAGASESDIAQLADYGLHAGRAFQITDDVIGVFGDEAVSGKSSMDDIREGKRTTLVVYAIGNAQKADAMFLNQCLGKQKLTMAEFRQCKQIIIDSGALEYAQNQARKSADMAKKIIVKNTNWPKNSQQFLQDLVQYITERKS
jgi:geranylgeranyl pyrophosphate synthase